uniref:Chromosome 8 open reading frame 58 n=1 Tax=Catagonus wagneri TaxID=51154 RepID=A0A8C3X1F1_9CETA
MLGRRRVFAVEPLHGGRDGAGKDLARGCVVPGVTSTYRRIADAAPGCSADSWKGDGRLRGLRKQVPLLKPASQDSGVEVVVGESSLATSPGLSQDSLDFEPTGSPELLALGVMEPPVHFSRLLASRKLEQVLERSRQLPTPPASSSQQYRCLELPSKPELEMPLFGAGGQEATKAESDLEAGLEEAEVVFPGQGLRYLEHLCLVLEQMARLQQLCLQLQTQRALGVSELWALRQAGGQDPQEEEESALVPSPPPSHAPGSEVHGPWGQLSQTETGAKTASPLKGGVPSARPPTLSEAPAEPAHTFPSSQGHKVKVLLNRIRWRSLRPAEPSAPPDGLAPRIASGDVPDRPPCHPLRKTFMPSLVVKKQRAKNLSVC